MSRQCPALRHGFPILHARETATRHCEVSELLLSCRVCLSRLSQSPESRRLHADELLRPWAASAGHRPGLLASGSSEHGRCKAASHWALMVSVRRELSLVAVAVSNSRHAVEWPMSQAWPRRFRFGPEHVAFRRSSYQYDSEAVNGFSARCRQVVKPFKWWWSGLRMLTHCSHLSCGGCKLSCPWQAFECSHDTSMPTSA